MACIGVEDADSKLHQAKLRVTIAADCAQHLEPDSLLKLWPCRAYV